MTKLNEKIECPDCKGGSHVKKGKSSNKQFQKLKCKSCGRNFRIELVRYDKQMSLPTIETRIVKYPNGGYSICKISYIDNPLPKNWVNCVEILSPKLRTYKDAVSHIRTHDLKLDRPGPVEIDRYIPENMVQDLIKLFGKQAQAWVNILNEMAK